MLEDYDVSAMQNQQEINQLYLKAGIKQSLIKGKTRERLFWIGVAEAARQQLGYSYQEAVVRAAR